MESLILLPCFVSLGIRYACCISPGTRRRQDPRHAEHTEGREGAHHAGATQRGEQTRPTFRHHQGERGHDAGGETRQLER